MPQQVEQEGWATVGEAWERVFGAVAELGSEIVAAYRNAYEETADKAQVSRAGSHADTESADEPSSTRGSVSDHTADITDTVERSISAARTAFDTSWARFGSGERGQELAGGVEDALRVSLAQVGTTLIELSDQIGRDRDAPDTASTEAPDATSEEPPDNVVPGPGAERTDN